MNWLLNRWSRGLGKTVIFARVKHPLLIAKFYLAGFVLAMASVAVPANNAPSLDGYEPSQLIEYEILLLRTEIAMKKGEQGLFVGYFHQLQSQKTPTQFLGRFQQLQDYFASLDDQIEQGSQSIGFETAVNAQTVLILLPLSDRYAEAGHQMLQVLQQGLSTRKVYVIDTDLYQDMAELWQVVKLFKPELIIGPLEKVKAESFLSYSDHIPTLLFTSINQPYAHVRSQAALAESNAATLLELLNGEDVARVAWMSDGSERAQAVIDELENLYQQADRIWPVVSIEPVNQALDKSLERQLGVEQSVVRKNWLQKTLDRELEFTAYVRQDRSLVVALSSAQSAMQIKPLLSYYARPIPVIWVPTDLPDEKMFRSMLAHWQHTLALLPSHFVLRLNKKSHSVGEDVDIGLFRALAELALKVFEHAQHPLPYEFESSLGKVYVDTTGKYYFYPQLFELNQARMRSVVYESSAE